MIYDFGLCYVYRKKSSDFTILAPNNQAISKKQFF